MRKKLIRKVPWFGCVRFPMWGAVQTVRLYEALEDGGSSSAAPVAGVVEDLAGLDASSLGVRGRFSIPMMCGVSVPRRLIILMLL